MIAFVSIAVAMLAAACAFVLVPLVKRRAMPAPERSATNLAVLRDQVRELESDLAHGVVSDEQYTTARNELDRRVLEEAGTLPSAALSRSGTTTAVVLAAALPIAAAVLYLMLGTPAALDPAAVRVAPAPAQAGEHTVSAQEIETMIARVREKLAREPDNLEGWVVLARTLYVLNRGPEAAEAFERAAKLAPGDAALLADWADALGVAQGRSLEGAPADVIARALAVDPAQWKANALAGTLAFERKQYAKAIEHWQRVKSAVPADSPVAQSIDASLGEARRLASDVGQQAKPPPSPTLAATAPAASGGAAIAPAPSESSPTPTAARIAGTVSLAAPPMGVAPEDTVFVYARAAAGPRMPLALLRRQVKDLPLAFTLDDSMAMLPSARLSDHREVIVTARISKSGSATPQPGDVEASSAPVKVGTTGVTLVLGR